MTIGTPFDRLDPHIRRMLAMSVVRTVLEDLNGMEEYATWTTYRVLYVPVGDGRVCIDTRVPKGAPWDYGVAYNMTSFQLSYRIHRGEGNGDLFLRTREVMWKGHVEDITLRVRNAMIEGIGVVSAHTNSGHQRGGA